MSAAVNYLARREAHALIADLYDELPTGTDTDDLHTSLSLYLTGFLSHARDHYMQGSDLLRLAQQRARTIYVTHFWQIGHSLWDNLRQRARIEASLLNTAGAPAALIDTGLRYHKLRLESAIYFTLHQS